MQIPLLILLALMPQEVEAEVRRQAQEIRELRNDVQELESRNSALEVEVQRPFCSATIRSANGVTEARVPVGEGVVVWLSYFSVVSRPEGTCLPAQIRVAASYFDSNGNLICSGVVADAARQTEATEVINLGIRPWNLREFLRWTNEPPENNSGTRMLRCFTPAGQTEISPTALAGPVSLHLQATVLPPRGGVATEEFRIEPQP